MERSIRPDKKYFTKVNWIQLTISVIVVVVLGIIHIIINVSGGEPEAIVIIWLVGVAGLVLMWLITTPIAWLWIKNLSYTIHGDGIRIYKGIITKTQLNIPFRAITDFALERTLFDRILGLGSIKIQTAGQSHAAPGYEGKLGGLIEYEEWYTDLRDRVSSLQPVSEAITTAEQGTGSQTELLLTEILAELREIRKQIPIG